MPRSKMFSKSVWAIGNQNIRYLQQTLIKQAKDRFVCYSSFVNKCGDERGGPHTFITKYSMNAAHMFSVRPQCMNGRIKNFPNTKNSDLCPKLWSVHIDKFFAGAVIIYHKDRHNLCVALLAQSKIRLDLLHSWKCSSIHIFCVKKTISNINKLGS